MMPVAFLVVILLVSIFLLLAWAFVAWAASIVTFIFEGIALTKLNTKKPFNVPWLIWIPYVGPYYRIHAALQMNDNETLTLFGKPLLSNKFKAFWAYFITSIAVLVFYYVFYYIAVFAMLIPNIGGLISCLILLFLIVVLSTVAVALCFFSYAVLRDLLNTFTPDEEANRTTAIWLTILNLFTYGVVEAIYLFRLSQKVYQPNLIEGEVVEIAESEIVEVAEGDVQ